MKILWFVSPTPWRCPTPAHRTHLIDPPYEIKPVLLVLAQKPEKHARIHTGYRHALDFFAVERSKLRRIVRVHDGVYAMAGGGMHTVSTSAEP